MKTSPHHFITGTITASVRHYHSLNFHGLLLLLTVLGMVLGSSRAHGNISLQNPVSGALANYGANCDPAYPLSVYVVSNVCAATFPWTITVTDGNTTTPHSVSTGPLTSIFSGYTGQLLAGGSATPTLNLTGLDPGPGKLVATDPCGNSITLGFNIVNCSSGAALVPLLGYQDKIAPNRAVTFSVYVANVGSVASVPTTLEINGIPPTTACTVASTSADLAVVDLGASQKVTVTLGSIAPGVQQAFTYTMQATPSAVVGSTFPLNAAFTSIYPYVDARIVTVVASLDPNAKYGPTGSGPLHNISPNTIMPYLITFENSPAANAPAQVVSLTDQLDTTKLDPFTFAFGPVHFGNQVVFPPVGVNPFSVTVPYDVDGNPVTTADNIYVRVSGNVDQDPFSGTYGKVQWLFESLDAPGGSPPPLSVGFLPANSNPPEGDGGVTFTVMQKASLAHGTIITNAASIVFDANAPLGTPGWTNRIRLPITLAIARVNTSQLRVTWSGGTLEQSTDLTGNNWSDAPVQSSPWTFTPAGPRKFFRVRD